MNQSYVPLYRKYRPQTIEQIVGQEHIKQALSNAITMNKISHAYLFTGPRGTGKTSTARIFAKSLNCVNGPTISPCNECENCKNITKSLPIDVIEIDAASNRSVSDAEEIIQNVALQPIQSRYKIYIIDEVHMLSTQAFNALLKTIEEPPKNVIFILATTEIHKVLDTIKSRCQRFDFKRITTDDIVKHLRFISESENINITNDALIYIAQNSAGGMRDSIALLDQLSILSSDNKTIEVEDITSMLGRLSFDTLFELFKAIKSTDRYKALEILNNIYNQGNEPIQILTNLLEFLRNALIVKVDSKKSLDNLLQLNSQQLKTLSNNLQDIEVHQLLSLTDKCANYIKELKSATNLKLWLDVSIIDLANIIENTKLSELQQRISVLENSDNSKPVDISSLRQSIVLSAEKQSSKISPIIQQTDKAQPIAKQTSEAKSETTLVEVPNSKKNATSNLKKDWESLLDNISSIPLRAILKQQALPVKIQQDEVIIAIKNQAWLTKIEQDNSKYTNIVNAANSLFPEKVSKVIVKAPSTSDNVISQSSQDDEKKKVTTNTIENKPENITTKIQKEEPISEEELTEITEQPKEQPSFKKDSLHTDDVNMILELFDGKIIE